RVLEFRGDVSFLVVSGNDYTDSWFAGAALKLPRPEGTDEEDKQWIGGVGIEEPRRPKPKNEFCQELQLHALTPIFGLATRRVESSLALRAFRLSTTTGAPVCRS